MSKPRKITRANDNIIQINKRKCIGCTACAFTCAKRTNISVLKAVDIGGKRTVDPKQGTFGATGCIYCGQCTFMCPTTAIDVRNDVGLLKDALNSGKYLIASAAPAVKATLGEEFGLPIGTNVGGKIAPSARKIGFEKVFDTDFAADMTAVEESTELIKRISSKENLPMFTSCCPAWVRYAELFHPEILENISTSKSPQQMMGASIKTYFAETYNILPSNIFTVSIKPCTAKKYEAERVEMGRDGYKDIDVVLTVREYAELLKEKGIDITAIPDEKPDQFMGEYTGAGVIFGSSGGVMQSTLRNATYYLKGDTSAIQNINFTKINGYENITEANINLSGQEYKVAVANGLKEVDKFISSGKYKEYLMIEVMACYGGCINGGGSPRINKKSNIDANLCVSCNTCIENCPVGAISYNLQGRAETQMEKCVGCTLCSTICRSDAIKMDYYNKGSKTPLTENYIALRAKVLKNIDESSSTRISDENENLQIMYRNYMGDPDGEKATLLLHTTYTDRSSELKSPSLSKRKKH